jgi:hypothetical protein
VNASRTYRRQGGTGDADAETGFVNNSGHSHGEMSFLCYCRRGGIDNICRAISGVATFYPCCESAWRVWRPADSYCGLFLPRLNNSYPQSHSNLTGAHSDRGSDNIEILSAKMRYSP